MEDIKIPFQGRLLSVQPRIRLTRSFDQRYHNYLGYCLTLLGTVGKENRTFSIGIGKAAGEKFGFRVGDNLQGLCETVLDPNLEPAEYYKVSKLKKTSDGLDRGNPPPWEGIPPNLETYRARGSRRLEEMTYKKRCTTCIWGCNMPVEIIIDQWNPTDKMYRKETFCYGPLSCRHYTAGPTRMVPGRKGMVYEEDASLDVEETKHRDMDE